MSLEAAGLIEEVLRVGGGIDFSGTLFCRSKVPLGLPYGPRHSPTVGSYGGAVSDGRGTHVCMIRTYPGEKCDARAGWRTNGDILRVVIVEQRCGKFGGQKT